APRPACTGAAAALRRRVGVAALTSVLLGAFAGRAEGRPCGRSARRGPVGTTVPTARDASAPGARSRRVRLRRPRGEPLFDSCVLRCAVLSCAQAQSRAQPPLRRPRRRPREAKGASSPRDTGRYRAPSGGAGGSVGPAVAPSPGSL